MYRSDRSMRLVSRDGAGPGSERSAVAMQVPPGGWVARYWDTSTRCCARGRRGNVQKAIYRARAPSVVAGQAEARVTRRASSARLVMSSLVKMCERWVLTVLSDITSCAAIVTGQRCSPRVARSRRPAAGGRPRPGMQRQLSEVVVAPAPSLCDASDEGCC